LTINTVIFEYSC